MAVYLADTKDTAFILDGQSSWYINVVSGVPQGTVMGPTLLLLYINNIRKHSN